MVRRLTTRGLRLAAACWSSLVAAAEDTFRIDLVGEAHERRVDARKLLGVHRIAIQLRNALSTSADRS